MPEAKTKKLNGKQWTILVIITLASIPLMDISNKLFHFDNSNLAMFIGAIPLWVIGAYVCRNLERKPFTEECKDYLAMFVGFILTCWIPFIALASIFHINNNDFHYLCSCSESYALLVIISVMGAYVLLLTMLLKKLEYLRKQI